MTRIRRPCSGFSTKPHQNVHYLIGSCEVANMQSTMKQDCYFNYKTGKYHLKKHSRKFDPDNYIYDIREYIKDFTLIEIVDYEVRVSKC